MKVIRKYHYLCAQDRRLITRILLHYSLRILHLAPRMNILAISAINPTGAQPDKNGAPPGVSSAPRSRLFFHFRSALRTLFTSALRAPGLPGALRSTLYKDKCSALRQSLSLRAPVNLCLVTPKRPSRSLKHFPQL